MLSLDQLDRQFVDWFRCQVPSDLRSAYERHPIGVEFEDRFFDDPEDALIHTKTRGLHVNGEFRLGQSGNQEFIFLPSSGKVVVRPMDKKEGASIVFASVPLFLIWMLELDEAGIEKCDA